MSMFGAYLGNHPANLPAYEEWLGRPLDTVLSYLDQSSWQAFENSIPWGIDLWSAADRPVIWGVPLVVDGSSLSDAALGAFDHHYRSAASAIAESRSDAAPIYVRIGWEFNGAWFPWAAGGHEADFIGAFRRAADIFHATSDRFQIALDVNMGGGNIDPATAYPGDAYVDVVGVDVYHYPQWDPYDPEAAFAFQVSRPYGLQWVEDFARAHNKPTAISEWGVQVDHAGPYVRNMAEWIADHDMVYAIYWETDAGSYPGELRSGRLPNVSAAFQQTFGEAPGNDTLVLQVSADSYNGDPQFIVTVDGVQLGGIQTARASHAAGQHDTITLDGNFGGDPSSVSVQFLNDAWGGGTGLDRNLYVEHLTVNGRHFAGDSAVNTAGTNTAGVAVMGSNGTATFDLADTLLLRVSADSYNGDPQFIVTVDGRQIGGMQTARASHAAGQSETITLRGDFGDNPGSVAVQFLNDAWGGRSDLDRNLYVEHLAVNGRHFAGSAAVNTAGQNAAGVAVMGANGTATFDLVDTLVLRVSADSYNGDPQFILAVDGRQVGEVQTARASHAAGQADTFLFRGDFGGDPSTVTVQFLNDAWGGRSDLDRNLYVEHLTVNGAEYAGSAAVNTAGANAGGVAVMGANGTATFHLMPGDWLV